MRTAAQVLPHGLPRGGIYIVVDGEFIAADFNALVVISGVSTLEADEFEFVRLCSKLCTCFVFGDNATHKALSSSNNAGHGLFESFHVFWCEGVFNIEVVIETVSDGRANTQLCFRIHILDSLGKYVSGRVAKDIQAICRINRNRLNYVTSVEDVS